MTKKITEALIPPTEVPYPVQKNWKWIRLQGVCADQITDGTHKTPTYCDEEDGIPFISAKDVTSGKICWDNIKYITKTLHEELYTRLSPRIDDVLLAKNGTTGVAAIVDEDKVFDLYVTLALLRPKKEVIDPHYLLNVINSPVCKNQFDDHLTGIGVPNLHLRDIKMVCIPVPPLPEQKRIVDRIESLFIKLDEAKEKAQAVVDEFEDRKAAILHQAFAGELTSEWRNREGKERCEWKELTVGDVAEVKGGKRVPKGMSLTDVDTGHPYIKAGNLKQGTVIGEGISYVPEDVLPYIEKYTVSAGDVYITNVGACIGDCGVIPPEYDGANLTENAVKLTNLKCISEYLAWFLSSNPVQQHIKSLIASATLGKLSIEKIKTIRIILPYVEEQEQVVQNIISLLGKERQVKEVAEQVISQIDTMKKTILARAFRGELGTNDPLELPVDISAS